MHIKMSMTSFVGFLDFGLLRSFCLGEQACHGKSVGSLYGNVVYDGSQSELENSAYEGSYTNATYDDHLFAMVCKLKG